MKRKLTDNEVDSVAGGGDWINDANMIQKIKQGICPYCGRTMSEGRDNYNGWTMTIYTCHTCHKEFKAVSGGWKVADTDDSGSIC